jgi:hypothetical protein
LTYLEESIVAGLANLLPNASLPVAGKLMTSQELQARVKAHVNVMKAARATRAKYTELVAQDHSLRVEMGPVLTDVRNYVAALYGEHSAEFASFGFKQRKTPERTPATKVVAAEKMLATRLARHTMGPRQRSKIHGTVPAKPPADAPVAPQPANGTTPAAAPPFPQSVKNPSSR